jgi:hypothetical protein
VVRGGKQHESLLVSPGSEQRGNTCCRRGISADRLKDEVINRYANLLELLGNEKAVAIIGEDTEFPK